MTATRCVGDDPECSGWGFPRRPSYVIVQYMPCLYTSFLASKAGRRRIATMIAWAAIMTGKGQISGTSINAATITTAKRTTETHDRINIAVWLFLPKRAMDLFCRLISFPTYTLLVRMKGNRFAIVPLPHP